jgi:hypothetical protein
MAPRPFASGVCRVTATFLCSGRNYTDGFFIQHTDLSDWSVAELNLVASASSAAWGTYMAPKTSASCSLVKVTALDLSDGAGRIGEDLTTHVGTIATGTSPALPLNVVARVSFQIPRRYRGARPSINVSGRVQSDLTDERTFSTTVAEALLTAVNNWIVQTVVAAITSAAQVGVSYVLDGAERTVPLVLEVVGAEIQERVCTLRKRLGKAIAELF